MKRGRGGKAEDSSGPGRLDWEAIVEHYQPRLLRVAFLITGDPNEAEDATQQAFLKGIGSSRRFRGQAQVYTWLYRILVNQCTDQMKKKSRYLTIPQRKELRENVKSGPEDSLLRVESSEVVRLEVMKLEPKHRVTIVLRHFEDLSYLEISRILGCPVGTVRSRLANAREILRRRLAAKLK